MYLELSVEILSGGTGHESKLLKLVKPVKDPKGGKAAAGSGAGAGGGGETDKAVGAEVLPVESPPTVGGVTASPDQTNVLWLWLLRHKVNLNRIIKIEV